MAHSVQKHEPSRRSFLITPPHRVTQSTMVLCVALRSGTAAGRCTSSGAPTCGRSGSSFCAFRGTRFFSFICSNSAVPIRTVYSRMIINYEVVRGTCFGQVFVAVARAAAGACLCFLRACAGAIQLCDASTVSFLRCAVFARFSECVASLPQSCSVLRGMRSFCCFLACSISWLLPSCFRAPKTRCHTCSVFAPRARESERVGWLSGMQRVSESLRGTSVADQTDDDGLSAPMHPHSQ
jgi:hypothetical protein